MEKELKWIKWLLIIILVVIIFPKIWRPMIVIPATNLTHSEEERTRAKAKIFIDELKNAK